MTSNASLKPYLRKKVTNSALILIDSQPNIDFFSRDDLKQVIRKFKEDCENGNIDLDQVSFSVYGTSYFSQEEGRLH